MMLLARALLVEFGVFVVALMALLGWQVRRAWRGYRPRAEEWVLAAGAVGTCAAYGVELVRVKGLAMPEVSWTWVAGFGACCAVYLGMKAARVWKKG